MATIAADPNAESRPIIMPLLVESSRLRACALSVGDMMWRMGQRQPNGIVFQQHVDGDDGSLGFDDAISYSWPRIDEKGGFDRIDAKSRSKGSR
jgi:hypothetical protein